MILHINILCSDTKETNNKLIIKFLKNLKKKKKNQGELKTIITIQNKTKQYFEKVILTTL